MKKIKGTATNGQKFAYFNEHYEDFHTTSNGWCEMKCTCGRGKQMAVNFNYEQIKCWSAKCPLSPNGDYKESMMRFLMKETGKNYQAVRKMLTEYRQGEFINFADRDSYESPSVELKGRVKLPDGFVGLFEKDDVIAKRARRYIKKRRLDMEMLDYMGFGYVDDPESPYFGRIVIPFKREGNLYYYICRSFMGSEPKYLNPPTTAFGVGKSELLFNEDALNEHEEVWLTEGWACAMTMGENGIACLGSKLSEQQVSKIVRSSVKVVNILPDYGFYQAGVVMALQLHEHKTVYLANLDEIGDEEKNDPNSLGRNAVIEHINQKTEFDEKDLYRWDEDDLPFM